MAESWEDVTWDQDRPLKEWTVEYTVEVEGEKYHHLNILYGENENDVQKRLFDELRQSYSDSGRINVTLHRMEETTATLDASVFDGCFTP